jgi:alcohol dehydrogenase class IV
MKTFLFSYGPKLVCGIGSSERVGTLLPDGPLLFVTDTKVRRLGLADQALKAFGRRKVVVFDQVESDPSLATLEAAIEAGRGATGVVGFGGGSPMDVAKLAAYVVGTGQPLDTIWGVDKATGQGLPLVLVPTTAGTGSEATPIAIITLANGTKAAASSPSLVARHAVLDPALTTGVPRSVTAATGMDAIVHAIEAYTSAHLKNPMSDALAREAIKLLTNNLLAVCEFPDSIAARSNMLLGAHLAGVAFANAPVGGVHALAYPLGGLFHVAHGLSNALVLPHVLRHNLPVAASLYAELCRIVDPACSGLENGEAAARFVDHLAALALATGMPQNLADVGVTSADLPALVDAAMEQTRLLANNPRPINTLDALGIYEAAL